MKNQIDDPSKLGKKLDSQDKTDISEALKDAKYWIEHNEDADKEDFEE